MASKHNVLLVTGGGWHDFVAGNTILKKALEDSGRFTVVEAKNTDKGVPEFASLSLDKFKTVLIYTQGGELTKEQEDGLVKFVESGGGLVGIHCANDSFTKNDRYMKLIGSQFVTHPPGTFEFNVAFTAEAKAASPIAARSNDFAIIDEHYIVKQHSDYDLFAVSHLQGKNHPMGYTRKQGKGTVVYLANGHWPTSLSNRYFQRVLERSMRVAAGEDLAVKSTVNVGIIGYGGAFNMGKHHTDSINQQVGMKVTAVCDLDPKRTAQAKTELGDAIKTTNKTEELLAMSDVNMVVVILPHNAHAPVCIAASKAGKHVVTEKPFCISIEEADQMIAASQASGKIMSCFHNRRWDIDFVRILDTVQSGVIGQVFHVEAASAGYGMPGTWWRSSKEISGGGLYDWGAHYCDWLLNLVPHRIESVSGNLQKRYWHMSTNEDFAQAHIRFEGGVTATIEQGNLAAIGRPGWRILGTTGGLTNGGPHQDITMVRYVNGVRQESKIPGGGMVWHNYYQNIGNHIHLGEKLIVTPQQARRAIGVLRLAELSSNDGGKPLPFPGEKEFTPDYVYPY